MLEVHTSITHGPAPDSLSALGRRHRDARDSPCSEVGKSDFITSKRNHGFSCTFSQSGCTPEAVLHPCPFGCVLQPCRRPGQGQGLLRAALLNAAQGQPSAHKIRLTQLSQHSFVD